MRLTILLLLISTFAFGQSVPISGLPAATTLDGTEVAPIVQTSTKKATISLIRGWGALGSANQLLRVNAGATGLEFFTPTYGTGTVTSVGFTGGLISVANPTTTPAFTVAGTSGGVPYFSSSSTWASSSALAANALVIGGGAGNAPSTTTTGAGVLTFLGTPSWTNFSSMITGTAPFWNTTGGTTITTPTITGNPRFDGRVGINAAGAATSTDVYLNVSGNEMSLGSDGSLATRTNSTAKAGRVTVPHYTNAEEDVQMIGMSTGVSSNIVQIGGGFSTLNTSTAIDFYTASATNTLTGVRRAQIDNLGNFIIGSNTARTVGIHSARQQSISTTQATASQSQLLNLNDATGPVHTFGKSRNGTPGSFTIVQNGDVLGQIDFAGDDGVDYANIGGRLKVEVDATPGSNDMPSRMVMAVSSDGSATPSDRYAILGNLTALTESTATTFVRINVPTGTVTGGEIVVTVRADDATDFQARTLKFNYACVNKAGTLTATLSAVTENAAASTGTLTATPTAVDSGSGNLDIKLNAVSSLTQTTLQAQAHITKNFGTGTIISQ